MRVHDPQLRTTAIATTTASRAVPACRRRRRGVALVYTAICLTALLGVCSLAVDWARVQLVKTEAQRCADATARGYMEYYKQFGSAYAFGAGPSLYAPANNPVDAGSGVAPTITVVWGSWVQATRTFTPYVVGPTLGVRVTVSRTAAGGNPVPLFWAAVLGQRACDVRATATAVLNGARSGPLSIAATANPYLAGMPAGTVNHYGDTHANAAPYQVTSVPVTPGTWVTLTNVAGSTNVLPGYVATAGADGLASIPVHHGQNYNYTIDLSGPENGIADAIMPESALMGLFLDDAAPNTTPAPSEVVDWTSPAIQNKLAYADLALKQPFMIGDGKTTGGVTQRFLVPPGATRMFVAVWDGIAYYNNAGSLTATITVEQSVALVQ